MTWPKSYCPQCGTEYYGWAFGNPGCHICSKCGAELVVEEGVAPVFTGLYDPEEDSPDSGAVLSI
jgi:hypothetical protein